jgi:hypothetical protein
LAGELAAILFNLIASCTVDLFEPRAYLVDVLTRLPQVERKAVERNREPRPGLDKWQTSRLHAALRILNSQ